MGHNCYDSENLRQWPS